MMSSRERGRSGLNSRAPVFSNSAPDGPARPWPAAARVSVLKTLNQRDGLCEGRSAVAASSSSSRTASPRGSSLPGTFTVQKQVSLFGNGGPHFAQQPALLPQPGQAVFGGQLRLQFLPQWQQVAYIGGGVGPAFLSGSGRAGPRPCAGISCPRVTAESVLTTDLEAGLLEPQKTTGELGVEKVADANIEVPIKTTHVVVGAMEHFANVGAAERGLQGDRSLSAMVSTTT